MSAVPANAQALALKMLRRDIALADMMLSPSDALTVQRWIISGSVSMARLNPLQPGSWW
jgi:hypothetical protein